MKRISLTKGQTALVDNEDYAELSKHKWCMVKDACGRSLGSKIVYMHRVIMDAPEGMEVDHINHNTLDNRRSNLRTATHSQNQHNRMKTKDLTSSIYKGVSWHKANKKYKAAIRKDNKQIDLGYFSDEVLAAKAYDDAAKKLFKEFAYLNFTEKGVNHG